jgi:SAM-dependent methyltransferase
MTAFLCNICSAQNIIESEEILNRDKPSCVSCGSNVRFRWTIHALSTALFGESIALKDFPDAPQAQGIGLSDEPLYAKTLAERLSYRNTFLHREPRFDLTDPACCVTGSLDFILATEVFEHIPPPVQRASNNLSRLLKPNGFAIFSTPWRHSGRTVEHFPHLSHWTLAQIEEEYFLLNKTREGKLELFDKLIFHGGVGHPLEMRLFSQPDLNRHFQLAGLEPQWATEPYMKYGIIFSRPWSIPGVVRKTTNAAQQLS